MPINPASARFFEMSSGHGVEIVVVAVLDRIKAIKRFFHIGNLDCEVRFSQREKALRVLSHM